MKILWSWLCEYLKNFSASPEEVSSRLTLSGTETTFSQAYDWALPFQVVRIQSVAPHPQASSLSICLVEDGTGQTHNIVCGASNVRSGMLSILAFPGCVLPGEKKPLEVASLRGIKSHGMLCSAEELSIDDLSLPLIASPHTGILDLDPRTPVGTSLQSLLPQDWLLELELTPNRGDLASHWGVARELSALGLGQLAEPEFPPLPSSLSEYAAHVKTDQCPQIYFCEMTNVNQGITPPLIRRRLAAIGVRLYFPCVDLTNYMAHDILRPLHIFDAEDIVGPLVVRQATPEEEFQALDGTVHKLSSEDVVLADQKGILSLGGIMGGLRGKCTASSTRILIECAEFSPEAVARTGQRLQTLSDARYRFERGLDPEMLKPGMAHAIQWITQHCQGIPQALFSQTHVIPKKKISFPYALVETVGGARLDPSHISERLEKLGAQVEPTPGDTLMVTPPSWRRDWQLPEDCVEEVLRLHGYEEVIPCPLPTKNVPLSRSPVGNGVPPLRYDLFWKTRRFFVSKGLHEAVTWSFISHPQAENFSPLGQPLQAIINPISTDFSVMRPSIIPSLLEVCHHHKRYGLTVHPIFEVGPRFAQDQHETVAFLFPQERPPVWPRTVTETVSFYQFKSLVEAFLKEIYAEAWTIGGEVPAWCHPGQSLVLRQGETIIGYAGALHPRFQYPCWIAEIDLTQLKAHDRAAHYTLPSLQAVSKDLSFQLPPDLSGGTLMNALRKEGGKVLIDLRVVDLFQPESGGPCLSLRGTFQPQEHAFTQEDLHQLMDRLIQKAKTYGAQLRGEWA